MHWFMISVYETCDNIIYSRKMTHDIPFYNDLFPKTKIKTSSHMTKTGSQYSETGWYCSKQNLNGACLAAHVRDSSKT